MHRIFSSTMADTGRQLKQSVNVFHSLMLYLRLPATQHKKHTYTHTESYGLALLEMHMRTHIRRKSRKFC